MIEQEPGEGSPWKTCFQQLYSDEQGTCSLHVFLRALLEGAFWIQGFQLHLLVADEAILGHRNVLKQQINTFLL